MLGSGGFVVFDQHVCAVDFARYLTAFNRVRVVLQMRALPHAATPPWSRSSTVSGSAAARSPTCR